MRQKLFDGENVFFRLMGKAGDFMCLNMLCILASLPIVTIGASVSALYEVLDELRSGKDGGCFKKYILEFKGHFRKATVYWMICLSAAVFLILGMFGVRFMGDGLKELFQAASVVLGFLWVGIVSFGLILIAWKDFTVREVLGKAVLITVGSFPWVAVNLLIMGVPILLLVSGNRFVAGVVMPLFVLVGIPAVGYVKMYVYRAALKKYGLVKEEKRA